MESKSDRLESLRRVAERLRSMADDVFSRNMLARLDAEIARYDSAMAADAMREPAAQPTDTG